MIESLHISNYALIDTIDITFTPGFNVITGETGAGKSIILGALGMLMGGRADTRVVRDPSRKSVIEATFPVEGYTALKNYCNENDIEWDERTCYMRREIYPTGRSRAFINDSPVNLDQLKAVSLFLVDIHSQHQNLLLASPPYQMQILDVMAGNEAKLEEYSKRFAVYRAALKEYVTLRREIEKTNENEEFMRYQLQQLESLNLTAGEDADLERERELLANVTGVKSSLRLILDSLRDGAASALTLVREAEDETERLSEVIEESESLAQRLESVRVELQDIADTFAGYDNGIAADPAQLEEIEQRLLQIATMERRHNVDSVDALMEIAEDLRRRLDKVDNAEHLIGQYEAKAKRAKAHAREMAREISDARKEAAEQLASLLRERALPLGMDNLIVKIEVTPADMSATGIDNVEFLFAFNKNQTPLPVGKTASGGEISRLMLSIKSIVASRMQLPSIIFDEVDTGVSGKVADKMGELMRQIARNIQVIAITHLPQVAAKGTTHFKVFKHDSDTETNTCILTLTPEERVAELAVMLGGSEVDQAALDNARSLLNRQNDDADK
ncbi:MAG: DNA repair protein RecN [Muribaculaceae bacterium]|nr:DNA repair protein RecN [Muribaculaceae bacterium]